MHHFAPESHLALRPMLVLLTLREKCPNTEVFLLRIFPYSVPILENTVQKKLRIINNTISNETFIPILLLSTQILEKEHLNSVSGCSNEKFTPRSRYWKSSQCATLVALQTIELFWLNQNLKYATLTIRYQKTKVNNVCSLCT